MKILIAVIGCVVSLSARANVDYISIGKALSGAKTEMSKAKVAFTCAFSNLAAATCSDIERLNDAINNFSPVGEMAFSRSSYLECGSNGYMFDSVYDIRNGRINSAKYLAKAAAGNDPVHAKIAEVDQQLTDLDVSVKALAVQADLQNYYLNKCILNNGN